MISRILGEKEKESLVKSPAAVSQVVISHGRYMTFAIDVSPNREERGDACMTPNVE